MRVGLYLPTTGPSVAPADVVRFAREAEAMGFDSLWTFEHLVTPVELTSKYPYTPDGSYGIREGGHLVDPLATLGVLAGATTSIRLGTACLLPTLRHPIPLAKALGGIHLLAGGRLVLGLAGGWMNEEFVAVGLDPGAKGRRLEEHLAAMRTVWGPQPCSFSGEFYAWDPCWIEPRPPDPIPVLLGGHADAVLRRVARVADGWAISSMLAGGGTVEERLRRVPVAYYEDGLARLRAACDAEGRDFASLSNLVSRACVVRATDDGSDRALMAGSPGQLVDDIRRLEGIGVAILNLAVMAATVDEVLPSLEALATRVLPEVQQ